MALGRGLQSIIPAKNSGSAPMHSPMNTSEPSLTSLRPVASADKIWQLPVGEVVANPQQPRRIFNEEELQELSDSIREHGVLQPITVSERQDGKFEIIAGERRWRASKRAGLATIPAIVRTTTEHEKLELAIIENVQRVDLSPIDEAFSYKRLYDEFGLTMDQVAERVGKSRPHVSNMIRLLDLPEAAKDALGQGKITMGKARALLSLSSEQEQLDVLRSMLGEGMTTREVEARVSSTHAARVPKPKAADVQYLESELRSMLGTKVSITKRGEKGTITIDFYSNEELENLVARMKKI
ncbi:MAG: ParB/RepB/Spo0J family partition protein [Candidatus Magasanikbacteria bacterium]|nr:ParB/RepB/Spo0J family partition protein [Candidatus Magasanikbacteria bacterium]